jgi:hypothetical protein
MSDDLYDGYQAFPVPGDGFVGMTLRDYFAGQVMHAMVLRDLRRFQQEEDSEHEDFTVFDNPDAWKDAASEAYAVARAMILAREVRP